MTLIEHLLNQLADEGCEVAHRALKAQKFGLKEIQANGPSDRQDPGADLDNATRIRKEMEDLIGVYELLVEMEAVEVCTPEGIAAKKVKVWKYLQYCKQQGTLEWDE